MDKIKAFLFKNTNTKQTVAKNTAWLFIGEMVSKISRALLVVIAARMLGAAGLGVFSYVMALGGMFMLFEDSGLGLFVTRELSEENSDKEARVATAMLLKLFLLTITIIIFLAIGPLYAHSLEAKALLPVMAIILFTDSLRGFLFSITRSQQKMEVESFITSATSILVLVASAALLAAKPTAFRLALGYAIGGTVGLLLIVRYARAYLAQSAKLFSVSLVPAIVRTIWPFAIFAIANMVILNIDVFLLGSYANNTTVGIYSAAQRLIQLAYVISSLIAGATFPVFARKSADENQYGQALQKVLTFIFFVLGLLVIGISIWANDIITLLFGSQYLLSGAILRIMAFGLIPIFISATYFNVIFALNRQRTFVYVYLAGLVVSIAANRSLIPQHGGIGAAISSVITFSVMAVLTVYLFNTRIKRVATLSYINGWFVAACAVYAATGYAFLKAGMPVLIGLPLSACIYAALVGMSHRRQLNALYAISADNTGEDRSE